MRRPALAWTEAAGLPLRCEAVLERSRPVARHREVESGTVLDGTAQGIDGTVRDVVPRGFVALAKVTSSLETARRGRPVPVIDYVTVII